MSDTLTDREAEDVLLTLGTSLKWGGRPNNWMAFSHDYMYEIYSTVDRSDVFTSVAYWRHPQTGPDPCPLHSEPCDSLQAAKQRCEEHATAIESVGR